MKYSKVPNKNISVRSPFLFNASESELQKFLILGIFVAGKKADVQNQKLNYFLELLNKEYPHELPLYSILKIDCQAKILELLKTVKSGKYNLLCHSLHKLAWAIRDGLNLRSCSRERLIKIPGIGLKTASFFIMFTRPEYPVACLDTHILKYLKDVLNIPNVPKTTPTRRQYFALEHIFLDYCNKNNIHHSEMDFKIWLMGAYPNESLHYIYQTMKFTTDFGDQIIKFTQEKFLNNYGRFGEIDSIQHEESTKTTVIKIKCLTINE